MSRQTTIIAARRHAQRRRWRNLLAAALLGCLMVAWTGCTQERRYEVLSFFFDGVPDPNAPRSAGGSGTTDEFGNVQARPVLMGSMHKPFVDSQCSACHKNGSAGTFDAAAPTSDSCADCHKDMESAYPVMHAPVVAKACLWCHSPHESPVPRLLRDASPGICVQCHEPALLDTAMPGHAARDRNCLDCHTAHGGDRHGLLRPGIALTTEPTTQPSPGGGP